MVLQFVIDENGNIDRRTVQLLQSADPRLANAVFDVLPRMHYRPAEIDGRPVKELVQVPFMFQVKPCAGDPTTNH